MSAKEIIPGYESKYSVSDGSAAADRIEALTGGTTTDLIAGMSREDCARRIEALNAELELSYTDAEFKSMQKVAEQEAARATKAEAERDDAVRRMEAGWIQVCAEPAIAHFKEVAEKAEAECDALRADAELMHALLMAAKCPICDCIQVCAEPAIKHFKERAEKAEAERDALKVDNAALIERCNNLSDDAVAEIKEIEAERDALRVDAERYRHVRDLMRIGQHGEWVAIIGDEHSSDVHKQQFDAEIDRAALDAKEGGGG